MSANAEHMTAIAAEGLVLRMRRAEIRRQLRAGQLTLRDVLTDPEPCIHTMLLFELVQDRRGWGLNKLRVLGLQAVTDRVNLAVSVGRASRRTLDWLVERDESGSRFGR